MNPDPLPQSCRPWAPGTSTGDVTWITGVLQSSEQPTPHTKLALHSFQLFLHTLQFLGQLITCRLARAGCKCDAGSCTHTHNTDTAQLILWRITAAHPTLQAQSPGEHCQGTSITGVVPGKGAAVGSICQQPWETRMPLAGCSHRVKSPKLMENAQTYFAGRRFPNLEIHLTGSAHPILGPCPTFICQGI